MAREDKDSELRSAFDSRAWRADELIEHVRAEGRKISIKPGRWSPPKRDCAEVFLVVSGWLLRQRVIISDEKGVTATYIAGDIFNLDCLVEPVSHDQFTAVSEVELIALEIRDLQKAIEANPQLSLDIIRRLVADGDWLREAVTAIGRLDALDRLVTYIGQTRRRLISSAMLEPGATRFHFPLTQQQIGEIIGVSTIHANRTVQKLQTENIATIRSKRIWIEDLPRIEKTLDGLRL